MKFNININLPQKSLFGFKVLTSLQSSLSCYLLLLVGRILNPLFGFDPLELIAGSIFNIILNVSVVILIFNIVLKRKQIKTFYFVLLNSFLLFYLPIALFLIIRYVNFLLSLLSPIPIF